MEPGPHPLAIALGAGLRMFDGEPRALLLGIGRGRNVPVLLAAGARVDAVEDDAERAAFAQRRFANDPRVRIARARYVDAVPFAPGFAGALSTHALLHGTPLDVAAAVAVTSERLAPGAALFATLGSKRDPRFGAGRPIADDTFAPAEGSESGVPHAFFDERGVRALFERFSVEDVVESEAAATVGQWAHDEGEAAGIVHWYVVARRRQ